MLGIYTIPMRRVKASTGVRHRPPCQTWEGLRFTTPRLPWPMWRYVFILFRRTETGYLVAAQKKLFVGCLVTTEFPFGGAAKLQQRRLLWLFGGRSCKGFDRWVPRIADKRSGTAKRESFSFLRKEMCSLLSCSALFSPLYLFLSYSILQRLSRSPVARNRQNRPNFLASSVAEEEYKCNHSIRCVQVQVYNACRRGCPNVRGYFMYDISQWA